MISKKLSKLLTAQVGHEFASSQDYLGIAAYFGLQSLDKWAGFFYRQSAEEREHALKIVRFLVDVDEKFSFPAVPESKAQFKSPLEAVKAAFNGEKRITKHFHTLAEAALSEKDYTTFEFIQWYIEEQVEEEATMQKLVDILETGINIFEAEEHIPGGE